MCEFYLKPYNAVTNPKLQFYKIYKDGFCYFDEFVEELEKRYKSLEDELLKIHALMDMLGGMPLPKTKFNHINPQRKGDRKDIWEFKSKHLRVYVMRKEPDIFIILGGLKTNQESDIKTVFRYFNDIPLDLAIIEDTEE